MGASSTGRSRDGADSTRQRKTHNRSRTGCALCKRRHTRCDEGYPSCLNCVKSGDECVYLSFTVRKGHERNLAGVQAPWHHSTPAALLGATDPFDSMPVSMPYRSGELMRHFLQIFQSLAPALPPNVTINCVTLTAEDPLLFRSVLLTAATHYATKAGGLHGYQATFRFHMAEVARELNGLLSRFDGTKKSLMRLVPYISSICINETRAGNFDAAKAHLDGILTLLDIADARISARYDGEDWEHADMDYLERCAIVSELFLSGIFAYSSELHPEQFRLWPVHKIRGNIPEKQDMRLQALGLVPYFMNKSASFMGPREMDPSAFIFLGKFLTSWLRGWRASTSAPQPGSARLSIQQLDLTKQDALFRIMNGVTDLLTWFGNPEHLEKNKPNPLSGKMGTTSVLPLLIASSLYYHRIIGVRPLTGDKMEVRMQRRKLLAMKRGLYHAEADMIAGKTNREMWFWELFCGLVGMEALKMQAGSRLDEGFPPGEFQELRNWFAARLRLWAAVTGVTKWEDAKAVLNKLAWPDAIPHPRLDESAWRSAMAAGVSSPMVFR
ncbi:hypothetical protein GQ53DRAFT_835416 [Thozetella sp. PMI_491]|nr:hypothetical protein GQ53DRAFT_835416 [Thozetella sp. PMI_491]